MLNLHPPFRRAVEADRFAMARLARGTAPTIDEAVVAEEQGRVTALLSGRPSGETFHLDVLAVEAGRADDLGRRILAIADALAAEEGLAEVTLDPGIADPALRDLLDEEGFCPAPDGGGLMRRPVVPQG